MVISWNIYYEYIYNWLSYYIYIRQNYTYSIKNIKNIAVLPMFVSAGRVQYGQIIWSYLSEGKSWKVPRVMEADSGICYYLMDMERWIHNQRTGIRMKGIRGIILRHFSFVPLIFLWNRWWLIHWMSTGTGMNGNRDIMSQRFVFCKATVFSRSECDGFFGRNQ